MIYLFIIFNSILVYLTLWLYHRYKGEPLQRKTVILILTGSNIILTAVFYLFAQLFPNNTFRDLFDPDHYNEILGNNQRYIGEIGESVFSGAPQF